MHYLVRESSENVRANGFRLDLIYGVLDEM